VSEHETDRAVIAELITTEWCASWMHEARAGDRFDPDYKARRSAWAQWALERARLMQGARERGYMALLLDGKFHDPKGSGPLVQPHLEVPDWRLNSPDPEFPSRLAEMGNSVAFPWWIPTEATACKRALFHTPRGEITEACSVLWERRATLVDAVRHLKSEMSDRWSAVEELVAADAGSLQETIAEPFGTEEIADFMPGARLVGMRVEFDEKLLRVSGEHVSRRIGVWQILSRDKSGRESGWGVLTPRLTANSQLHDRLFYPEKESSSALLVRALVLKRVMERHLGILDNIQVGNPERKSSTYFRAMTAQVGQKLPESSPRAAVWFLQTYPDPERAWAELNKWAQENKAILTVREDSFLQAHKRAWRFFRRGEELERDDINNLLPLAWDSKNRVVRVGFGKRGE
jgi:hypothetical protein